MKNISFEGAITSILKSIEKSCEEKARNFTGERGGYNPYRWHPSPPDKYYLSEQTVLSRGINGMSLVNLRDVLNAAISKHGENCILQEQYSSYWTPNDPKIAALTISVVIENKDYENQLCDHERAIFAVEQAKIRSEIWIEKANIFIESDDMVSHINDVLTKQELGLVRDIKRTVEALDIVTEDKKHFVFFELSKKQTYLEGVKMICSDLPIYIPRIKRGVAKRMGLNKYV